MKCVAVTVPQQKLKEKKIPTFPVLAKGVE